MPRNVSAKSPVRIAGCLGVFYATCAVSAVAVAWYNNSPGVVAIPVNSSTLTGIVCTMNMCIFYSAILGVIFRRGPTRAFCFGFSVFTYGYLLLVNDYHVLAAARNGAYLGVFPLLNAYFPSWDSVLATGQAAFSMGMGILGGFIAQRLQAMNNMTTT